MTSYPRFKVVDILREPTSCQACGAKTHFVMTHVDKNTRKTRDPSREWPLCTECAFKAEQDWTREELKPARRKLIALREGRRKQKKLEI